MRFRWYSLVALFLSLPLHAQVGTGSDTSRAAAGSPSDPLLRDHAQLTALAVQARRMQEEFEKNRRNGLRFYNGGAYAKCDVEVGGICYSDNNGDVPPPSERNDARVERLQLLETLERAQQSDPTDNWVSGMFVRYAVEANLNDMALRAARACGGAEWWCNALLGLAYHVASEHQQSESAFARSIGQMPEDQRCLWTDLTPWMDTTMHADYRATPCGQRASNNARIFRMAKPLWMIPGNDISNEWFSRWTITRIYTLGRLPYDYGTPEGLTQIQLRYGWPTAWSMQAGLIVGSSRSIIGHEPTPSYDFMPLPSALANPVGAGASDWEPTRAKALMRYSPRYASGFSVVPHQFSRFIRNGQTVLAGAWRLQRELEMGAGPYTAALFTDKQPGATANPSVVRLDSAGAHGALLTTLSGTERTLVSLEVMGTSAKRAARVRAGVSPLPRNTNISEMLLLQRWDPMGLPQLETVAKDAFGSLNIDVGTTVGLYWEVYGDVSPEKPATMSVVMTRTKVSFMQRFSNAVKISRSITPVSIRYVDKGREDAGAGRAIQVPFTEAIAGEYELKVKVSGVGFTDSSSVLVTLRER